MEDEREGREVIEIATAPERRFAMTIAHGGAVQKCSDARRTKKRAARRIFVYVERCGLQSNTADERF